MQIGKQKVKRVQEGKLLLPSSCSIITNHWPSYLFTKIQRILISLHVQSYPTDEHNPICGATKDLES